MEGKLTLSVYLLNVVYIEPIQAKRLLVDNILEEAVVFRGRATRVCFAYSTRLKRFGHKRFTIREYVVKKRCKHVTRTPKD